MRRLISLFLIGVFIIMPIAYAASPVPPQTLWVTPEHPSTGDIIELNAFVYNSTAKSATISVAFLAGEIEIATAKVLVAPQSAKVAVGQWQMPQQQVIVTAKVTGAVDAARKTIPELIGTIGTVSLGSPALNTDGLIGTLKGWLRALTATIEPWRVKQAQHFTQLREKKKAELGITSGFDIAEQLTQKPEAPATPGGDQTIGELNPQSSVPIGGYIVLICATALAAVFTSIALFYIALVLLTLFVLRFLLGLFR